MNRNAQVCLIIHLQRCRSWKTGKKKPTVHKIAREIAPPSLDYKSIEYAPREVIAHVPDDCSTPIDYFRLYITERHSQLIAQYINYNAYNQICGRAMRRPIRRQAFKNRARSNVWHDVCASEIDVFIGILLAMGLTHLPSTRDYWNTHTNVGKDDEIRRVSRRYTILLSLLTINC